MTIMMIMMIMMIILITITITIIIIIIIIIIMTITITITITIITIIITITIMTMPTWNAVCTQTADSSAEASDCSLRGAGPIIMVKDPRSAATTRFSSVPWFRFLTTHRRSSWVLSQACANAATAANFCSTECYTRLAPYAQASLASVSPCLRVSCLLNLARSRSLVRPFTQS